MPRLRVGDNDLYTWCINNGQRGQTLIKEWRQGGIENMKNYSRGSHDKVQWECEYEHKFEASILNRVTNESNCPQCSGKFKTSVPEQYLYIYLEEALKGKYNVENRYKALNGVELDIVIRGSNIAIEYNGGYYHNNDRAKQMQNVKEKLCRDNGIRLIVINECEYWNEPYTINNIINIDVHRTRNEKELEWVAEYVIGMLGEQTTKDVDIEKIKGKAIVNASKIKDGCSLAEVKPELVALWSDKNEFNLSSVAPQSHKYGIWKCPNCKEESRKQIAHVYNFGFSCPVCKGNGRVAVANKNSIKVIKPLIAIEYDRADNEKKSTEVTTGSREKANFKCIKCNHMTNTMIWSKCNKETGCNNCGYNITEDTYHIRGQHYGQRVLTPSEYEDTIEFMKKILRSNGYSKDWRPLSRDELM